MAARTPHRVGVAAVARLAIAQRREGGHPTPEHSSSGTSRASHVGMASRILVAEDDPEMLRLVVEILRADGHTVEPVWNGSQLLVRLVEPRPPAEQIDLVVADVRMPVMTGLQVLSALRRAHRSIPVILMTAFGDEDTRTRAESMGAMLFDKPFELAQFRKTVDELLAAPHPDEELPT